MGRLSSCVGIVLAGGKSSRFGSNKALARVGSSSFVEHLYQLMNEVFEKTYVVLHEASSQFSKMNTLLDIYPDGGPLNGIYSALMATEAPAIFVCACDLPMIRKQDIEHLLNQWQPDSSAVVYRRNKRWEPLCGIYPRKLIRVLPKFLDAGYFRLQDFLNQVGALGVEYPGQDSVDSLLNINTPEDYQKLKELESNQLLQMEDL